ncbi:DUF928 domain-containing protein [Leptolyngbya sp. AN02str]|uniref:DUF928 domain-containing protein n=1 Tax=Leptolyngbya sp. AN02str TaxID=3423363 RepID=UPI003D31F28C
MTTIRKFQRLLLPLVIGCSLIPALGTLPAIAQQNRNDRSEFPGRRVGGGTRGSCPTNGSALVALNPASNLGKTMSDRPSLYFLVPPLEAGYEVEFYLRDAHENPVYDTKLTSRGTEEIVEIQLPSNTVSTDQDYHWFFVVVCDPLDRTQNMTLEGWLRRVEAVETLRAIAPPSSIEETVALARAYWQAEIWTDAIALMVNLRQANPANAALQQQWTQLLQALELSHTVEQIQANQL